ncbi:TatD family hydrolase [Leucobacter japonicus]|uniref:TatD family hydrolase n=1 Tax=Leucobacter japonicus TaxID=1461259 RepID=UPI0009E44EB0|nr:TatD family hydrolase [Leucobacter japonicus]
MRQLPPLDTHAHVALDIAPHELENLGAVVLIATRSTAEFQRVRSRTDRASVWGLGCHPGLVGVQQAFEIDQFQETLHATPYVSEIGLDGSSRVNPGMQLANFTSILDALEVVPRVTSIHSYRATRPVLDALKATGECSGIILHWWLGDADETREAVDLGCYFSVNYAMTKNLDMLRAVPVSRLLLETDHPSGDRFSPPPRRPGHLEPVERRLAKALNRSPEEVRELTWRNFGHLAQSVEVEALLPAAVRRMLQSLT